MKISDNLKKQVHKQAPKRRRFLIAAVLTGVLGMTVLFSMGRGFLPLFAANDNIRITARVTATSLTGVSEENIIAGRENGADNATEADVGDTVFLNAVKGNSTLSNALILYTTQVSVSPGLTQVKDNNLITELNAATGKVYASKFTVVSMNNRNYIGYKQADSSNLWYSYNSNVKVWNCGNTGSNETILIPESMRGQGAFKLNVLPILYEDTAYVARDVDTISLGYYPRQYTGKVSVTYSGTAVKENVEQVVDMAASIRIAPSDSTHYGDTRYFYTLDGSLPQYRFNTSSKVMEADGRSQSHRMLPILAIALPCGLPE